MVISTANRSTRRRQAGVLMTEVILSLGIIATVMIPLAYAYLHHQEMIRACYYRAVAMEILDGEMEVLMAGERHAFKAGTNDYVVRSRSAVNLPDGTFRLAVEENLIRLEWLPKNSSKYHSMKREAKFQ